MDRLPAICPWCDHVIDNCRVVPCEKHAHLVGSDPVVGGDASGPNAQERSERITPSNQLSVAPSATVEEHRSVALGEEHVMGAEELEAIAVNAIAHLQASSRPSSVTVELNADGALTRAMDNLERGIRDYAAHQPPQPQGLIDVMARVLPVIQAVQASSQQASSAEIERLTLQRDAANSLLYAAEQRAAEAQQQLTALQQEHQRITKELSARTGEHSQG